MLVAVVVWVVWMVVVEKDDEVEVSRSKAQLAAGSRAQALGQCPHSLLQDPPLNLAAGSAVRLTETHSPSSFSQAHHHDAVVYAQS